MRAITICMLVALTVNGTTLWAEAWRGSEGRHGERTGPRKNNHQGNHGKADQTVGGCEGRRDAWHRGVPD